MARLNRFTQLLFGSSATSNQIAQFGSLAAGTPARYSGSTITPAIIQNLSNYLQGWYGATIGPNSPAIEDMNALCYLYAFQLAYIMQLGMPEWDTDTTYYTGSLAQAGDGVSYVSLTDNNTNNQVTDSTKWFPPIQSAVRVRNSIPFTAGMTCPTGQTVVVANCTITSGQTVTAPSNSNFMCLGSLAVTGTGVIEATGTGVIQVI